MAEMREREHFDNPWRCGGQAIVLTHASTTTDNVLASATPCLSATTSLPTTTNNTEHDSRENQETQPKHAHSNTKTDTAHYTCA